MKIALFSDLHLEFGPWQPPDLDADVVILAGDIHKGSLGLDWAAHAFWNNGCPPEIIYVAGNHEFYGASLGLLDQLRAEARAFGIHFLEKDSVEIGDIRFLGCTLWSQFDLRGSGTEHASMRAALAINDFGLITTDSGELLTPRAMRQMNLDTGEWLDAELAKPFDGKTVIVSHFAPHRGCISPQFQGSDLSPYFVTDMSSLMAKHRIDLWAYGHTHTNADFVAENGCRVLSNQRGYPGELAHGFRPDLVLEL